MYIHTQKYLRTEFPPRANNTNCPFSLLAHVALTILVLSLCYQTQTHRINTTLCSLFSCGLLHALQPRVLYGWEAAQPVIMAFLSLVLPSYLCITAWWISATLRKCHRSDLKLMLCKEWKKTPKLELPLQGLLPADAKPSKVPQVTHFSSAHFRHWCIWASWIKTALSRPRHAVIAFPNCCVDIP